MRERETRGDSHSLVPPSRLDGVRARREQGSLQARDRGRGRLQGRPGAGLPPLFPSSITPSLTNLAHFPPARSISHETDIADGSLRGWQFRTFANLVGDYYVAPSFMNAVADHLVKNALVDAGSFDKQTRVPLILGIWGGKGQGKSFQTELALRKLGAECVVMSAGEMEDEWAGVPGKRIRERYRAAADLGRVRGKLTALVINDIDAGAGVFKDTQRTGKRMERERHG